MAESFILKSLYQISLGIGGCCVLARYSGEIRLVLQNFFLFFLRPFHAAQEQLQGAVRSVRGWVAKETKDEAARDGESPVYFIVGALFYTMLTLVFTLCDYGLIALTSAAFGMGEAKFLPADSASLTTAAIISTSLFWGSILTDLMGWTHIAPWRKALSARQQKCLKGFAVLMVTMCVFVGVSMAYYRQVGLSLLNQASAGTEDFAAPMTQGGLLSSDFQTVPLSPEAGAGLKAITAETPRDAMSEFVFIAAPMVIAGLCMISPVFSGWGLFLLSKFFILLFVLASLIFLVALFCCAWLGTHAVNGALGLLQSVVDFLVQIGASVLRLFGWRPDGGQQAALAGSPAIPAAPGQAAPPEQTAGGNAGQVNTTRAGFDPYNPFGTGRSR